MFPFTRVPFWVPFFDPQPVEQMIILLQTGGCSAFGGGCRSYEPNSPIASLNIQHPTWPPVSGHKVKWTSMAAVACLWGLPDFPKLMDPPKHIPSQSKVTIAIMMIIIMITALIRIITIMQVRKRKTTPRPWSSPPPTPTPTARTTEPSARTGRSDGRHSSEGTCRRAGPWGERRLRLLFLGGLFFSPFFAFGCFCFLIYFVLCYTGLLKRYSLPI